jgi:sortase A
MSRRTDPPSAAPLRRLERVLLLIAAVLLCWYVGVRLWPVLDQAVATRELELMRTPAPAAFTPAPRAEVSRGALVGRIELPRLEISAVVREGDDDRTLRTAVGHIPGTAMPGDPGNAGLAGHRDTFFRNLRRVRVGDRIVVTTPASIFHYTVTATRIVTPTDVSVLDPTTQQTLTLVTCYPFTYIGAAPLRFIVRAELEASEN